MTMRAGMMEGLRECVRAAVAWAVRARASAGKLGWEGRVNSYKHIKHDAFI